MKPWDPIGNYLPTFLYSSYRITIFQEFIWIYTVHNTFSYNTIFYIYSHLLNFFPEYDSLLKVSKTTWRIGLLSTTSRVTAVLHWVEKLAPSKKFFCIHYQGFDWICRWNILLATFWYFCSLSYAICKYLYIDINVYLRKLHFIYIVWLPMQLLNQNKYVSKGY